jgi:hypothetical protein
MYYSSKERDSEVDLMSGKYPLSFHRRIERKKSLRQIHSQIVVAVERTLQRVFKYDGSLIPIPVRTVVDRRRLDRCRLR